jgi:hypothetical protein
MQSNRWPVLLVLGSILLPASLTGCRRGVSVAGEDPVLAGDRKGAPEVVVRAQSGKDDKAESAKRDAGDGEGFRFPDDRGGALLAKVLPPSLERSALDERRAAPKRKPAPPSLEAPLAALPPAVVELPRAALDLKRPPLRPRLVQEETLGAGPEPVLPQGQTFATGTRLRLPSVDVNVPPPLPALTQGPVPDRASLDDPTADAAGAAVLAAPLPERINPAPFQRLAVPDPYENRRVLQVEAMPPERNDPPVTLPETPKR